MDLEHVRQALALKSIEGIGNVAYERLTRRFGGPREVFRQHAADLAATEGISPATAQRIAAFASWRDIDREITTARRLGVRILTAEDPDYPSLLRHTHDRPALLYVKGKLIADEASLAIVGSRNASPYGKFTAEGFSRDLARQGLAIVSGLARGIDTAAHKGALLAGGPTIAVLGCGLDVVYPPENAKLLDRIAETGAIVSECALGTQPLAANFPPRNRIISGMSLGTLVMEATEKSGSLITANFALEQGREVFAVPGPIDHPGSRGTHWLIKQGAKLVESVADILEEIAPRLSQQSGTTGRPTRPDGATNASKFAGLDETQTGVLSALAGATLQIDALIEATALPGSVLLDTLLALELKGLVEQLPGKIFRKKGSVTIE